jgi:hypothetical protein
MTGVGLIAQERRHQVQLGFTASRDDEHVRAELVIQSAALALAGTSCRIHDPCFSEYEDGDGWGFLEKYSEDRVRALTVAGALLAAEIDRLQRATEGKSDGERNLVPKIILNRRTDWSPLFL